MFWFSPFFVICLAHSRLRERGVFFMIEIYIIHQSPTKFVFYFHLAWGCQYLQSTLSCILNYFLFVLIQIFGLTNWLIILSTMKSYYSYQATCLKVHVGLFELYVMLMESLTYKKEIPPK